MATKTPQSISCVVTGLSQDTTITWMGPDDQDILASDTNNYAINPGSYDQGAKTSTLQIKVARLDTLPGISSFKCKVKSAQYTTYSPEVVKSMTLTLLKLGLYHLDWCSKMYWLNSRIWYKIQITEIKIR